MEVKFTEDQQQLILMNYKAESERISEFPYVDRATAKNFLLGCIGDLLAKEIYDDIMSEMLEDTTLAIIEGKLK